MLNKKTIILIIIIVLAVGAGTLWYVNRNAKELARGDNNKEKIEKREKEAKKQDVAARNNNEQESDGQEAEKTAVEAGDMSTSTDKIDTSDWQTYQTKFYSIKYPKDFRPSEHSIAGEEDVIFWPPSKIPSSESSRSPLLRIEYMTPPKESLETSLKLEKKYRFKKGRPITQELIDGEMAWSSAGRLKKKTVDGLVVDGEVSGKIIVFTKGNNIFVISYGYGKDMDLKRIFDQIIATFKFKN